MRNDNNAELVNALMALSTEYRRAAEAAMARGDALRVYRAMREAMATDAKIRKLENFDTI